MLIQDKCGIKRVGHFGNWFGMIVRTVNLNGRPDKEIQKFVCAKVFKKLIGICPVNE
jgi:hypothetical protein